MLKKVTITNYLGESVDYKIEGVDVNDNNGLLITKIDGLGPVKADVNMTKLATADGGIYNSARLDVRNIVIEARFTNASSIEEARLLSYKFFPIKKQVSIRVETDNRIAETTGYVESNMPNIFSKESDVQISIICESPFFLSPKTDITVFAGTEPVFEFPFENELNTEDSVVDIVDQPLTYQILEDCPLFLKTGSLAEETRKWTTKDGENVLVKHPYIEDYQSVVDIEQMSDFLRYDQMPVYENNLKGYQHKGEKAYFYGSSYYTYTTGKFYKIDEVLHTGGFVYKFSNVSDFHQMLVNHNYVSDRYLCYNLVTHDGNIYEESDNPTSFVVAEPGVVVKFRYGSSSTAKEWEVENITFDSTDATSMVVHHPGNLLYTVNQDKEFFVYIYRYDWVEMTDEEVSAAMTNNLEFHLSSSGDSVSIGENISIKYDTVQVLPGNQKFIEFGNIVNKKSNVVHYSGDSQVGCIIEVHALGPVGDLTIYNMYTRERMKIDSSKLAELTGSALIAGDTVTICTIPGKKSISLLRDGATSNILNVLGKTVDWLQLSKGDNVIGFLATDGEENIKFRVISQVAYEGV